MKEHPKKYIYNNQKNFWKGNKSKKGINDYQFYISTNKQAAEYEIAAEFIINFIKRTFDRGNDIAEILRTLKLQDTSTCMPKLNMSTLDDTNIKTLENRQYELECKALLDEAIKRTDKYSPSLYKAYVFLWEKCSRAMQNKITSQHDFEQKIFNNPINLLKAIKEHSLNFQESRYEMAIITDAIRTFLNKKQKESESLPDYMQRFKTSKEIMESHIGGPIILSKYIQITDKYKDDLQSYQNRFENETIASQEPNVFEIKYLRKAASKLYAYVYLDNSDKSKYDSILKNFNQQNSFGNNQYLKI